MFLWSPGVALKFGGAEYIAETVGAYLVLKERPPSWSLAATKCEDFREPGIRFYYADWVIHLPSEY